MEQNRILVVDDEQDFCDILQYNLTKAGYVADAAGSAEEALEKIEELKSLKIERLQSFNSSIFHSYDLLLLDVMMPRMSGFELAERLKGDERTAHIPIIFLTAKDTEEDTLQGFGLGADDYVTKPFSVREVLARVKAVLKRSLPETSPLTPLRRRWELCSYEGLVIDFDSKSVTIDGEPAPLTRTEYDLLRLLLANRGQFFSRQELLEQVWPQDVIVTERTVDVNIARLRKKLGQYAACLVSRSGFGYSFK